MCCPRYYVIVQSMKASASVALRMALYKCVYYYYYYY